MPIMMKRKDGTITPFRNAEYLSAYYFIPKRILEQCGKELNSIPRNPQKLIRDYNAVAVVESDLFIQLMMDAYAYMVWPYMCPGECMEVYSGYDPAWIFAHSPAYWVQEMLEENVIPPSSRLLRMNGDIDWVTEKEVNDILLWLVPQTMAHYGMREVISIAEEYRCFEDFDFRASNQKRDFYRKWYHTQTKHPQISLDGFKDDYAEEHDGLEWDIEDESSNFENGIHGKGPCRAVYGNTVRKGQADSSASTGGLHNGRSRGKARLRQPQRRTEAAPEDRTGI